MNLLRSLSSGVLVSGLVLATAAPALAAGNPAKGKAVFARCAMCHATQAGVNRVGPSLAGVVGRKAGTAKGYAFSPAMKKYARVWNGASLSAYLAAPMKAVPGTKMAFAGVPNAAERADLIAYLQSLR